MKTARRITTATLCAVLLAPALAGAHGTSKPGPHGGEVRMPGAFHVEAVAGDGALELYLLDVRIENPTTEGSWVDVTLHQPGETLKLSCAPRGERFTCPLPGGASLDQGRLVVNGSRGDVPRAEASYELPLTPTEAGPGEGAA